MKTKTCPIVAFHMLILSNRPEQPLLLLLRLFLLRRGGLQEELLLARLLRAAEPEGGRRVRRARQGQERLRVVRLVSHLQPLQEGSR